MRVLLSEEQLKEYNHEETKENFMDMDSDKNGYIDYKEYINKFIQMIQIDGL